MSKDYYQYFDDLISHINKTIPMVYGKVQKAPCVLWKNIDFDSSTLKRIYTLVDRFDIPVREGESDLFKAMKQISKTNKGPEQQTPSAGCSIKWKNN